MEQGPRKCTASQFRKRLLIKFLPDCLLGHVKLQWFVRFFFLFPFSSLFLHFSIFFVHTPLKIINLQPKLPLLFFACLIPPLQRYNTFSYSGGGCSFMFPTKKHNISYFSNKKWFAGTLPSMADNQFWGFILKGMDLRAKWLCRK